MLRKKAAPPLDMCNGPIRSQMLRFAVPLMLSGILQLIYNAADLIVVGRFTGSEALAAVGATGSLTTLLLNAFLGLSVGTNVTIARAIGAKDDEDAGTATHTAILLGILCGMGIGTIGAIFARPLAMLMDTPADVIDGATLYFRIIAFGFPASLLYNFGAAVLRAIGDTKRPLYFLFVSGLVNVLLNLFFVIVFHMGVAGVALATIISQYLSMVLVIMALCHLDGPCHLSLSALKIHRVDLRHILKIGVPAGIQSCCFNIANVIIQSSINSFGSAVIAGNAAAVNIEGFIYIPMNALEHTVLTFMGQNLGAKNYRRLPKILRSGLLLVGIVGGLSGIAVLLFRTPLLSIYIKGDAEAIAAGALRLVYIASTYYLCGWMECYSQALRALGHSTMPMFTCVGFVCGLRLLMVFTLFRYIRKLDILFLCFPVSWVVVLLILFFAFRHFYHHLLDKERAEQAAMAECTES